MIKTALKPARKVHKYLGYLLALQIFAWLLGGLVMSAIPLEMVHGKHLANRQLENPFNAADYLASLDHLKQQVPGLKSIEYKHFLDIPIIKLNAEHAVYFHGKTGALLHPPSQADIEQQAKSHYIGNADIVQAMLMTIGPREVQYRKDIWQVTFNDRVSTTIYLDSQSGQVITVRSTIWRIFDFFWMLHIMDYDERDDFNNPLLISFSATSVLFCISGFILLLQSPPWRRRRRALK
ncbi:hypothetical protein [Pseudoalteromonas luteoviolacea]|uniref:PepSY domain-containing protein n=1 Tax=Pseudoalteromonas luteoviolacea S4054 TaxID=1129367 RepID=A0A0F6AG83_9GAMM|nr:hypothetical protein [Pseudoalteromonas luteoviolacea]AOT09915.1 hypothetical protein S4054249_19745 [Pseudoalteromonas luteoviolacea]AOT14826.1 hypothetical protein S40542_19715 [Pseudoalteromonas luteoviolacea]AOT19742.1 hypothetical protein S4054_19720 [Pseudoalteromonas luteoviolacea]KKE85232.1 hypothetical protein N479_05725 [Pseudoalteromonas luteoviolacea S4054]KZN64002.1 hypothetical protein N481_02970 [Pseudoalteromonas luteoviolacea S4047-1]